MDRSPRAWERAEVRVACLLVLSVLLFVAGVALVDRYSGALLTGRIHPLVAMALVFGFAVSVCFTTTELALCLFVGERSTRTNIRLLVGTIAILLVVLELVLRFGVGQFDTWQEKNGGAYVSGFGHLKPSWLWLYTPSSTVLLRRPEFSFEIKTNSQGLRDVEYTLVKPVDEYRILVLGDSFAMGAGAALEESWPKRLEQRLRSRFPERTTTVMNAGIGGSDPWYEYMLLAQRLLPYRPDLVIVAVNRTDIFDMASRGGIERFRNDGTVRFRDGPAWEWLYASSYLVRLVVHAVLGYNEKLVREDLWDGRVQEALDDIFESISRFQILAQEHGFRLVVVFHPLAPEVSTQRSDLTPLVDRLRRDTDVHVLDLFEYFLEEANMTRSNVWEYYWRMDGHHNANGYALLAKGIEVELTLSGTLDARPSSVRSQRATGDTRAPSTVPSPLH